VKIRKSISALLNTTNVFNIGFDVKILFIGKNPISTTLWIIWWQKGPDSEINLFILPLPSGNYTIIVQAVMRGHKSIRGGVLQPIIAVL
jgi:hypothetical protein